MNTCAHHWLLGCPTPGVSTVDAECKLCGITRTFPAFGAESKYVSSTSYLFPERLPLSLQGKVIA